MIFLSSRDRKKEIKKLCKKYNDLPNEIVKQIVKYKLYNGNNMKLSKAISTVKNINSDIIKIQTAINESNLVNKVLPRDVYIKNMIFVDDTNGYSTMMKASDVMKKLEFLKQTKREIIMDMKYQYYIKRVDKFSSK